MGWLVAFAAIAAASAGYALYDLFGRYARERDQNRRVRALFSRYVPAHVVDELLERNDPRLFTAQAYYATILNCRIRNFALFAERLTPEETLRYLNEFYAIAGAAIERRHGVIETLRGDGITAVFGVLIDGPFQEERALRAALEIVRLVNAMSARWQAQGRRPFEVTVGVHSGDIVAGDVGFARRREFAIVGNPAHVAARLQQAAQEINASVLASATTFEPVSETFVGVPASTLPLQGLKRLQPAYVVRGLAKRGDEPLLRLPAEEAIAQTVLEPEPQPEQPELQPQPAAAQPHFSHYDASPALPELPPFVYTYEDGDGPPIVLPS